MTIYRGFRGQEQKGVRVTNGIFASEGVGVYIALDRNLAEQFASSGKYVQELEFKLDKPIVVRNEKLYMLSEDEEIEEPVHGSDPDWLKANKLAYQWAMEKTSNNWSKASEIVGQFLTDALKDMGYDGVMVDQGKGNRWAVVFSPKNVVILNEQRHVSMSREERLAKVLVYYRGINP